MGRLRSLIGFFSHNSNNLKGGAGSYESTVASDPPVKGTYPVAGNGPNVLEEIQTSRAKKEANLSRRTSTKSRKSIVGSIRRVRDDGDQRPRTAPQSGPPSGEEYANSGGRTSSGFSTRTPPPIFSDNRRFSLRSSHAYVTADSAPPLPPTPILKNANRDVQTYQPKGAPYAAPTAAASPPPSSHPPSPHGNPQEPIGFAVPYAQPPRTASQASHRTYVDILDAYTNIRPEREVSQHRAKASGLRNYGEDVADRNITVFAEDDLQDPDFNYLKSVYASKKRQDLENSRTGSAIGHVLGSGDGLGDDITTPRSRSKPSSLRTAPGAGPGTYPTRVESMAAPAYGTNRFREDDQSVASGGTYDDGRGRALSPLSSPSLSTFPEPPDEESRPGSTRHKSLHRGRRLHSPPPVALHLHPVNAAGKYTPIVPQSTHAPSSIPVPIQARRSSLTHNTNLRKRSESNTSQTTSRDPRSRTGSVSYSAFPSTSVNRRQSPASDQPIQRTMASSGHRQSLVIEGASEAPSLEGSFDPTNLVDTEVTTKTLPAAIHEKVHRTEHEIRNEDVTKEMHTHDVYHRIQPIIETEVLPTKHYIHAPDGRSFMETPESQISSRTTNSSTSRNRRTAQTRRGEGDNAPVTHGHVHRPYCHKKHRSHTHVHAHNPVVDVEEEAADAPVIGLARGEARAIGRARGDSMHSAKSSKSSAVSTKSKNLLEPILSSKKDSSVTDGLQRTDHVWNHPPTYITPKGRAKYIGAGIGDLSPRAERFAFHSDEEEDDAEANFGAMRSSKESDLLFRDSGYGETGGLPGIQEPNHLHGKSSHGQSTRRRSIVDRFAGKKGTATEDTLGEATKALRRMRENGAGTIGGPEYTFPPR